MPIREIVIYLIVAISSLILFAYTVHMFVGGLVEESTEKLLMVIAVTIGAIVMGFMARDIANRRKNSD